MGYRGKLAERQRARELRASGMTLAEIADRLHVSKGSVSGWVRDVPLPPDLPPRAQARRRGPNALQRRKAAEIEELAELGRATVGTLSEREFLMAGIALYAGEGGKRDGEVAFSNSNSQMMALFCRWFRYFFDIDEQRMRVALYLHEGLDLDAAVEHWSGVTGIPAGQFQKPYRAVADGGIRASKHVHGCATVRYSCARTHRAVMGLVAALLSASDPG
jgi:transcriptional regulator with XRE-family HTH domain